MQRKLLRQSFWASQTFLEYKARFKFLLLSGFIMREKFFIYEEKKLFLKLYANSILELE